MRETADDIAGTIPAWWYDESALIDDAMEDDSFFIDWEGRVGRARTVEDTEGDDREPTPPRSVSSCAAVKPPILAW